MTNSRKTTPSSAAAAIGPMLTTGPAVCGPRTMPTDEQPQHRAEPGALEQDDRRRAGAEQQHRRGQQLVEVHPLDPARFAARLAGFAVISGE